MEISRCLTNYCQKQPENLFNNHSAIRLRVEFVLFEEKLRIMLNVFGACRVL